MEKLKNMDKCECDYKTRHAIADYAKSLDQSGAAVQIRIHDSYLGGDSASGETGGLCYLDQTSDGPKLGPYHKQSLVGQDPSQSHTVADFIQKIHFTITGQPLHAAMVGDAVFIYKLDGTLSSMSSMGDPVDNSSTSPDEKLVSSLKQRIANLKSK